MGWGGAVVVEERGCGGGWVVGGGAVGEEGLRWEVLRARRWGEALDWRGG